MKNQHLASHNSATLSSPVTSCLVEEDQTPKYWSSERVPTHSKYCSTRRHVNASALLPFSSGRTFPSKWDDAERWISSPVAAPQVGPHHQSSKSLQIVVQSQRRTRSKSGPLSPEMFVNCGNYSEGGGGGGSYLLALDSPLLATSVNGCGDARRSCPGQTEEELASTRDWFELLSEPQPTSSQGNQDPDDRITRGTSRRDMSTQMLYPNPRADHCSPASSSPPPHISTSRSNRSRTQSLSTETELVVVRDVKVDKEDACKTKNQRKFRRRITKNSSLPSQEVNDAPAHAFRVSPPRSMDESRVAITKLQREEAKINSWENRQKEKAEAAIRKLEVKLEKKRMRSVEKILKKLKKAELKAERMRSSLGDGRRSCCLRKIAIFVGKSGKQCKNLS